MSRLVPLYAFDDAAEWHHRHSSGVELEYSNESKEINAFNAREYKFSAWAIARLHRGKDKTFWVFLVRAGEAAVERLLPREGESCEMLLWTKSGKTKRWEKSWEAERIENPAASFGIPEGPAHRMPAFRLKVPSNVPEDIIRALADDPDEVGHDAPNGLGKRFALSDKKAYQVTMVLRVSSATRDAEIGAIDKVFKNQDGDLTPKQEAAFKYLLNFESVPFSVNLFQYFPHLRDPTNNPGGMPPKVITMLRGFDRHQQDAYKSVLNSLPCGIGIIPGGPGAGKTHWNLVLTAAIQSKNVTGLGPDDRSQRSAKVLYILDINKPLDDTCNKIVKLYRSLGLKKNAVRLYGWRYGSAGKTPNFTSKFVFMARMNRYRRKTLNESCLAPTLDELVWDFYQANKTSRYSELYSQLSKSLAGSKDADPPALKSLVNELYRDVLVNHVDFIATTPVPAATGFNGIYKPDIVIFDESPHAREASTMVAIARFEPIAWIFSGDHRQTRPFVASDDPRDNYWAPQMLVSMMERADRMGAFRHSLLINHRAHGRLQELASGMFYDKMMISGHKEEELFPPSVCHLQRYLERFLPPGQACGEPRLLVYDGNRTEVRTGTSWYNPAHIPWVMERVQELLFDTMFKQVGKNERGTILIISPYKESYMKYKRAIRDLAAASHARLNVEGRVEARTIDTVQGGEADFVFLDMVRSVATDFTDDPNRLNVALTRARQAEIILMHPDMRRGTNHLCRVFAHCHNLQQVIDITERRPRQIAKACGEERAYEKHVSFQRQFDEERQAFGLDPRFSAAPNNNYQPADADAAIDDGEPDSVPPSIFSDQFAGLAVYLQEVLDGKDAKARPEPEISIPGPSQGARAQVSHPVRLQKVPDGTFQDAIISQPRVQSQMTSPELHTDQNSWAQLHVWSSSPDQQPAVPSWPAVNHSPDAKPTQQPSVANASQTTTKPKARGLKQSMWSDAAQEANASDMAPQDLPGNITKPCNQSMAPPKTMEPAASHLPSQPEQPTLQSQFNSEAARIHDGKTKASTSSLPSGSSWW